MNPRHERLAAELKALANPVRLAVLVCIANGIEAPAAIWRHLLEDEPHLSLSLVSYHIEKLTQGGLVRLARTERIGKYRQKVYKATARGTGLLRALGVVTT